MAVFIPDKSFETFKIAGVSFNAPLLSFHKHDHYEKGEGEGEVKGEGEGEGEEYREGDDGSYEVAPVLPFLNFMIHGAGEITRADGTGWIFRMRRTTKDHRPAPSSPLTHGTFDAATHTPPHSRIPPLLTNVSTFIADAATTAATAATDTDTDTDTTTF
ncbi:uncharacterized protein DFL_002452 [Arthrobotrys flagrans]|uniref:Uncharacterized protein n=1 Tax=Arthrobotrys flagrans TaxID=97331 RepID=A0A437AAV2_ARTFL|nr:hypothetical protein DFL_002452 [Arthrobotrys flagrans]